MLTKFQNANPSKKQTTNMIQRRNNIELIRNIMKPNRAVQRIDVFPKKKILLPPDFQPHEHSVIIGKGRAPKIAPGNKRLRAIVGTQLENYSKATLKKEKTFIVSNVLYAVQQNCSEGAFVKFDGQSWWEVDDVSAREKITATFRDCLSYKYSSSSNQKSERRRTKRAAAVIENLSRKVVSTKTRPPKTNESDQSFSYLENEAVPEWIMSKLIIPPFPGDEDR